MFQPFNPDSNTLTYRRNLPHWTQPGCTYFVTFRLADALPQSKLQEWRKDRDRWFKINGITTAAELSRLSPAIRREYAQQFTKRFHDWLDAGEGACILREPRFARIVGDSLRHFDGASVTSSETSLSCPITFTLS